MITIDENNITIPRKTWDRFKSNYYYKELIENILDSEELIEAIDNSTELVDLREYDRKRRPNQILDKD
jgi:hypothetical protein